MPLTYQLIASSTVGSGGAASVTFSSIPSTYTDLVVVGSARNNRTGQNFSQFRVTFNNDTGSNYSDRLLYGTGSTVASSFSSGTLFARLLYIPTADVTANTFGNFQMYILNYTLSNPKSVSTDTVMENNSGDVGIMGIAAGLWNNTAAITSIELFPDQDNLVQYSSIYLYGIKNS